MYVHEPRSIKRFIYIFMLIAASFLHQNSLVKRSTITVNWKSANDMIIVFCKALFVYF